MTTGANLVEADCVKSSDRKRRMKFSTVELEVLVEEASKRIVELRKEMQDICKIVTAVGNKKKNNR